jgi:Asp-tRNA(Asn)/Glu-tRNA(Gln) amidotransferase A subunit family amidase
MRRREFLQASLAMSLSPLQSRQSKPADRLDTFADWVKASRDQRVHGLQGCLDRIRALDSSIQAWVQVSPERPTGDGPLSEIPVGVKDIIETRGLATEYGSPLYKGRIGTDDAAIVRELRQRGAIVLGKTQSAAFAYKTPAPTRNPRNLEHTPGGSSSGSAAAVAARMVPFALGTQTGGSVLRPASYCGVTGFKASYGVLPMDGVLQFAKSLDTLGFFTETPADMLVLWQSLGHSDGRDEDFTFGTPERLPDIDPAMVSAFQKGLTTLRGAGISVRVVNIADMVARLAEAADTVMFYEGARFHEERYKEYGTRLGDLADLVRDGLSIHTAQYEEAKRYIDECRTKMTEVYKATPVILVPAATGPAPLGLASTGDSLMNRPWTALGTPTISIPLPTGKTLPLGLQLTASYGEDGRLLRTAVRLWEALHS